MSNIDRSLATPRPRCPKCGGRAEMFVEKGRRGDFQVIHCEDIFDCCWYWVPDGACEEPGTTMPEMIFKRAFYGPRQVDNRGCVIGFLAARLAAIYEDADIGAPETLHEKIIDAAALSHLVQIAWSIRNSRAFCHCSTGDPELEFEFDDPEQHEPRCPVGAAKRIIANALRERS